MWSVVILTSGIGKTYERKGRVLQAKDAKGILSRCISAALRVVSAAKGTMFEMARIGIIVGRIERMRSI